MVGGALAVGVVEHDVLGARQRGGGVHGGRHIEQGQLQVRRRRGRLLGVVLLHRQRLVVAAGRRPPESGQGHEMLRLWIKNSGHRAPAAETGSGWS